MTDTEKLWWIIYAQIVGMRFHPRSFSDILKRDDLLLRACAQQANNAVRIGQEEIDLTQGE